MDTSYIQARIQSANLAARTASRGIESGAPASSGAHSTDPLNPEQLSRSADTARKFQAVFTTMLVKEMRRGLESGFFGEGSSGDIYSGWLDDRVGQVMANRDALHMQRLLGASFREAERNTQAMSTEVDKG